MPTNAVVGLKPGLEASVLLELATSVLKPSSTIHLVSLVQVGKDDNELARLDEARSYVDQIAERLTADGYETTTTVQVSAIGLGAEIVRLAERKEADLIIIGLGKRSRVQKALLGGDAQSILLGAHCPVLSTRLD